MSEDALEMNDSIEEELIYCLNFPIICSNIEISWLYLYDMDLSYDEVADALYITLNKGEVSSTEQQNKNVLLDFDEYGKIIGIEIINFSSSNLNLNELIKLGDDEMVAKVVSS